jgi:hypothetical protein
MQGAQKLRSEAYLQVRCNDEVAAQRRRWTFYETIKNIRLIYCDWVLELKLHLQKDGKGFNNIHLFRGL